MGITYAPVLIEAPTVAPRPFGLLSAAQVEDVSSGRIGLGVQYEVDYCGEAMDSLGICEDLGTATISTNTTRHATIDSTGAPQPDGGYYVLWGDEVATPPVPEHVTDIDGATHAYTADGTFDVIVTGPRSYRAAGSIVVTNGSATGATDLTVSLSKVDTEGIETVQGIPFALLHLFKCKAPGSIELGAERARRSLQMGEGRGVERVLAAQIARDPDTVVLSGSPVHPVTGLALLEKYLGTNYPGVGVIHAPLDVATLLGAFGTIDRYGNHLETKIGGQRVAAGGGYDPLLAPSSAGGALTDNDDGVQYLYATGAVLVTRTAMIEVGPQIGTSPADNYYRALAERVYAVTYECVAAAVPVISTYEVPDA